MGSFPALWAWTRTGAWLQQLLLGRIALIALRLKSFARTLGPSKSTAQLHQDRCDMPAEPTRQSAGRTFASAAGESD